MKALFPWFLVIMLSSCTRHNEIKTGNQDLKALLEISKTVDEKSVSAESLSKKLVILNFWASWCGPCMEETPALLKLVSERKNDLILISVSEDDSKLAMQGFIKLFPLAKSENVFLFHDVSRTWSQSFGVYKFPETYFFDANLKPIKKIEGAIQFDDPEFKKLLLNPTKKID